jgi:hypothetical protein
MINSVKRGTEIQKQECAAHASISRRQQIILDGQESGLS